MKNGTITTTPTAQSRERSLSSTLVNNQTPFGLERIRIVVEDAVEKANIHGDPRTGEAIQVMYRESFENEGLANVLNALVTRHATTEQYIIFEEYMKRQKRLLRTSRRLGRQYNNSLQSGGSDSRSREKPPTIATAFSYNPAQPATETLSSSLLQQPSKPSRSSRSMSPSTRSAANTEAVQVNGTASSKAPARPRSGSVSSLSSLSDVDETIVQQGPPTSLDIGATTASKAPAASNGTRFKLSLTLKQPKPSKTKSSASRKRTPEQAGLDREPEPAEEALNAVREKLNESLVKDYEFQESNIRPPPIVQPESGRQSPSVRVPPLRLPVASSREPNGVHSHLTREQLLQNGRSDFGSSVPEVFAPGVGSASRPDTPLVSDRPAKKRKTAARVKMS